MGNRSSQTVSLNVFTSFGSFYVPSDTGGHGIGYVAFYQVSACGPADPIFILSRGTRYSWHHKTRTLLTGNTNFPPFFNDNFYFIGKIE